MSNNHNSILHILFLPFSYIFIIETLTWYNIKYTCMETTEIHLCLYFIMSTQSTQDFLTTKEIIRTVFYAVETIQPYATSYKKK